MNKVALNYISPAQKLHKLAPLLEQPWAVLLDSGGSDVNYNRYDIFCFEPSLCLSSDDKRCQLIAAQHLDQSSLQLKSKLKLDDKTPLVSMRKLLAHFKPQQSPKAHSLPFNGGWLGYISYDFGRQLEVLPQIASDDINLPQIQMGLYQWALITDHKTKQSHLYNFGLEANCWQKIIQQFAYLQKNDNQYSPLEDFKLESEWQSNTDDVGYYAAFDKIQDYINNGDCYQVNFAQRFSAQFSGSTLAAYQKLTSANQAPFSAYCHYPDHQILSLSPERFIKSANNQVITQPIKGTRPRKVDPAEDAAQANALLTSDKDRAENLMIVDLMRNDLSRTATQASVKVSELFGHYQFSSVHHLISTIESQLAPQFDNFDLLATTLPGGSITGAPKIRAMQIIEELEPVRRNIYCGTIGYIDFNGYMDTNICIRTLIAKNNTLYCWAGGGLVTDSDASSEYQETFDKLAKILPVLAPDFYDHQLSTSQS